MSKSKLAVLILAAGTSSRLGQPKQLVKHKNKTLIEIAVKKALDISLDVFVVLGKDSSLVNQSINSYDIKTLVNPNFENGIGSSISYAISYLEDFDKTLIVLCDQPFIPKEHLEKLINESKDENRIICSYYNQDIAVPALFPKKFYNQLKLLQKDKGAKAIILNSDFKAFALDEDLAFDIDTQKDLEKLQ